MRILRHFILICFLSSFIDSFSQTISYIIPDIGSAGINSYVEIIGPYNQTGNFGTDGIYANNIGDAMENFNAGASLVQLYTGFVYEGPGLIKAINKILVG